MAWNRIIVFWSHGMAPAVLQFYNCKSCKIIILPKTFLTWQVPPALAPEFCRPWLLLSLIIVEQSQVDWPRGPGLGWAKQALVRVCWTFDLLDISSVNHESITKYVKTGKDEPNIIIQSWIYTITFTIGCQNQNCQYSYFICKYFAQYSAQKCEQ